MAVLACCWTADSLESAGIGPGALNQPGIGTTSLTGSQVADDSQVRLGSSQAYTKRLATPRAASPRSRARNGLRIDPSRQRRLCDPADRQHVGSRPQIDLVLTGHVQCIVKRPRHDSSEPGVDLFQGPE